MYYLKFLKFIPFLLVLIYVLCFFSPLEIKDETLYSHVQLSFISIICISFLILIAQSIFKSSMLVWQKIIIFILAIFGFIIIYIFLGLNIMFGCKEETNAFLFKNKLDKSEVIIERASVCGGDEENTYNPKDPRIVKVTPMGEYFQWVISTDTSKIDKNIWINYSN